MVSMANYPNAMVDFQAFAGPGDRGLRSSEVEGYQPVSRIGEVVMNCFVDAYEFTTLKGALSAAEMDGSGNAGDAVEYKPMFHECAAAACHPRPCGSQSATHSTPSSVSQVGHRAAGDDLSGAQEAHRTVPVQRRPVANLLLPSRRSCSLVLFPPTIHRQYVAAETAAPVIACAACLPSSEEKNFYFAGVARSKSVRGPDDGIGPSMDEYFTLSIGGMATVSAPAQRALARARRVLTPPSPPRSCSTHRASPSTRATSSSGASRRPRARTKESAKRWARAASASRSRRRRRRR